jgi:hypothetical protein
VNNLSIERDNTEIVLSINGNSERLSLTDAVVFVSMLTAMINEALAVVAVDAVVPGAEPVLELAPEDEAPVAPLTETPTEESEDAV